MPARFRYAALASAATDSGEIAATFAVAKASCMLDVAPSPDVDVLADDELDGDESDPDCADGVADATPWPDATATQIPNPAASPQTRRPMPL